VKPSENTLAQPGDLASDDANSQLREQGATLQLTRAELQLIKNAIFDACFPPTDPIEEWEFPTRMEGLERADAIDLAERIRDMR